ncbi:MAG: hypothetical protein AABY18_02205 [Candidatus Thermoplasmatota archaeon]
MHKALLGAMLAWALALAGCSGGNDSHGSADVTCPNGTVLTAEEIEAHADHHADGFDAASLCPVAPKVVLSGLPATIPVYRSAPFTWVVDPGSVAHGHSMLTSIRYASVSVPDADLVEGQMTKYPTEITNTKKEHQSLPVTFKGNMTFNQAGKVYLRAYAQVQGDGFPRIDVWSAEVVLDVLPVVPTDVVHEVTHATGPLGELDPEALDADLGDAVKFVNSDLIEHKLTLLSGPPGSEACELTAAGGGESATTCVFLVPGPYTFETDDVQAKSMTINVRLP